MGTSTDWYLCNNENCAIIFHCNDSHYYCTNCRRIFCEDCEDYVKTHKKLKVRGLPINIYNFKCCEKCCTKNHVK